MPAHAQKTLLHIGCGRKTKEATTAVFRSDEWSEIRADIDPSARPDVVTSMTHMPMLETASFDAVYSSHNLEHLYAHEVGKALREFLRVLKPDGYLVLTCPDLQSIYELVSQDRLTETAYQSPAGPISPLDMLYGLRTALGKGQLYMAHRCGFTRKSLTEAVLAAGFLGAAVSRRAAPHFDLWLVATRERMTEPETRRLAAAHFPRR